MRIEVITVIPEVFGAYLGASILGRAMEGGLLQVNIHNLRDYTEDKHHTTDDYPFGGGAGMVMKIEPMAKALDSVAPRESFYRILCCPQGRPFGQPVVKELALRENLCILCGRYEGFDERVREIVDDEISLGDFVLTGGELAAMVMIDAVARFVPGVLGNAESAPQDSHSNGLLEYPHYTRPREFNGKKAPDVLLSGNHALIEKRRRQESLYRTRERRPDLFEKITLSEADKKLLTVAEWCRLEGDPSETPPRPAWKSKKQGTGNGEQGLTEEAKEDKK
jgi:tRNA (guanine37-N1)-methyltransferase